MECTYSCLLVVLMWVLRSRVFVDSNLSPLYDVISACPINWIIYK